MIVFETNRETDMGLERILYIYKGTKNQYTLWQKSNNVIGYSTSGGMMGDPFERIDIKNGCIIISQEGGDYNKWQTTHRFRWQNEQWQLIGLTAKRIYPLNYAEIIDYNLSTGKIIYEKKWDGDNQDTKKNIKKEYFLKLKTLPEINQMSLNNSNEIKIPDSELILYY